MEFALIVEKAVHARPAVLIAGKGNVERINFIETRNTRHMPHVAFFTARPQFRNSHARRKIQITARLQPVIRGAGIAPDASDFQFPITSSNNLKLLLARVMR